MSVLRIIDANANRAREALRVMEEAARFLLDDRELTAALKRLRHELVETLRRFDGLELHRDTPGDVGTTITSPSEMSRASAAETVIAAGKRLGEAMRALEEYGKRIDVEFAALMEKQRYVAYDLEQRLDRCLGSGRSVTWRVCVILGEAVCAGRDWFDVASAIADAVPDCIQLREKELPDPELLERASRLVERVADETAVVINDRADIALMAGAHGVHVGQADLPCREIRTLVGRRLLVGVSTSRVSEARNALRDGADYCGIGPMFASTTKPRDHLAGPEYLRDYLEWNRLPHLAIGGVTPGNVGELAAIGCRGVAVSSAVCAAPEPGRVVRALREALDRVDQVLEVPS